MEETRADILGDLFQGAISHGQGGQYFTPEPVCEAMARMTLEGTAENSDRPRTVCDPCCGSGRMLLAVAKLRPHWWFVGQDIDLRCVRMTALNLALRNLYGRVIWGDTLKNERRLVYQAGFDGRGFISEAPIDACPLPAELPMHSATRPFTGARTTEAALPREPGQLFLFD